MDKSEHGRRLAEAMAEAGYGRGDVANLVDRDPKTVTNWTSGKTMPEPADRAKLRKAFPGYDASGDAVERAVRGSELIEWRQDRVISEYKRHLHEQREEVAG